ncbi:MAG: hypothetical protein JRG97_12975 [Deltaproteobacteria bacterium]|nr:hypothetical protein [Deltaproteobacteria bacterium]MBW2053299.1 hypothetical protein [Deltaproteobacteria bacterium]MBW2141961.1 hypothetical protein [Deltaproteobacteria bacterium]MBW2323490.1 hypothetical protein [Deltaproteobacteria bacterium]
MENKNGVAFLVRSPADIWECTRSCVGLSIENLNVALFIIDAAIEMGERMEAFLDLMEMIDDLEGKIFSNIRKDADRIRFIKFMTVNEMAREIRKYDLLAAF